MTVARKINSPRARAVREAELDVRIRKELAVKHERDKSKIARLKALRLAKLAGETPG